MSCDITLGRIEPCKNQVGGLKAVYFVNYDDLPESAQTVSGEDVLTAVTGDPRAYKYDLRGDSTFEQTITSSRENGTTVFEQALTLNIKTIDSATNKQVKLLAHGRPKVIVLDNNGKFYLAGRVHGCDVTGGTISTGASMGDKTGYSVTFTGMEQMPANYIDAVSESALVSLGFEIVDGNGTILS
jgi:hypothetical protein